MVVQKRDQYRTDAKMSLFTNGYRVGMLELSYFDNVFLKLDVGSEEAFNRFNGAKDITLGRVIDQIKQADVDQKIIQSMMVAGVDGNYNSKDIEDYLKVLKEIQPDTVGLYSILYQGDSSVDLTPVSKSLAILRRGLEKKSVVKLKCMLTRLNLEKCLVIRI